MPPQGKFNGEATTNTTTEEQSAPEMMCGNIVSISPEPNESNNSVVKKNPAIKDVDFDDLLPHVGEFGAYQKILFCLMIPFAFYVAWVYFSQIFITLVPEEHWCKVPELMDLPVEQRLVYMIF